MKNRTYFVENLNLIAWATSIWPHLLRERHRSGFTRAQCHTIDGSGLSMLIARASARLLGVTVRRLDFRLTDVRDETGMLIRLRIPYKDLAELQQAVVSEPEFQELIQSGLLQDRLGNYVVKNVTVGHLSRRGTMWRALYLVQVCVWRMRQVEEATGHEAILFLEDLAWMKSLREYASRYGVTVVPVRPEFSARTALRRRFPKRAVETLRRLRYRASLRSLSPILARTRSVPKDAAASGRNFTNDGSLNHHSRPRVAVEYIGQLNLTQPERHSEFFFWQQSQLSGGDLLVTSSSPSAPLDEKVWSELKEHSMAAVALHPGATTVPEVPVFTFRDGKRSSRPHLPEGLGRLEKRWFRQHIADYDSLRSKLTSMFSKYDVKMFLTWSKNDAAHYAIADALESLGGVTAVYQRSYESASSPETTVDADLLFGYSKASAEIERRSNSKVRYHVVTGYLGDHRFSLLREIALETRLRLQGHGAKRILALFDENNLDDARWNYGPQPARESYSFVLEKILAEPWLGLVVKPKAPRTLRRRLGPVAELLERAEATGRCYVHEGGGPIQGWYPPAVAALAADVAVHIHINAGSAAIDAALAGVPTLVLDRERWSVSPFYRLGAGQVVFTDWEELWEACVRQWSAPDGSGKLGDWSPMLDDLDPFRDGRAAERMGTYIQWLMQGFKAGLNREMVMAEAAERYCSMWGSDKVTQLNGEPTRSLATNPSGRT